MGGCIPYKTIKYENLIDIYIIYIKGKGKGQIHPLIARKGLTHGDIYIFGILFSVLVSIDLFIFISKCITILSLSLLYAVLIIILSFHQSFV